VKQKIEQAAVKLREQITKLDQVAAKLKEQDDEVFSRIVSSLQDNDSVRAKLLANELSLMLKMSGMLTEAKLALEQLTLRLSTVNDIGEFTEAAGPSLEAIRGVRPGLATLVPDSEHAIGEISDLISGALEEAGQIRPENPAYEPTSEEAEQVVAEATAIHEQKINLPIVPETTEHLEAEPA
jgi:division protein CdvB (Snf7/Vps24/ESCRT-III family)